MKVAILDSCVLYSAVLRDFFMRLLLEKTFQGKWTEEIHQEWIRNVLEDRPDLAREQLERSRDKMNLWGGDCLVRNYEAIISSLSLPDENDRHVLATAIVAKANFIVTFNLSDFPPKTLQTYEVQAIHPDKYLCALLDLEEERFLEGVRVHRASLKKPPKTPEEYLETLRSNGLTQLTSRLKDYQNEI